jgi:glycosyltransferase involved in cell wall biosynthesis
MATPTRSGGPQRSGEEPRRRVRLAYLVSHPIQYQAPLLRRIAQEEDIDLTVFFGSDFSMRSYADKGFGVNVEWDTPLLEGYRHEFLPVLLDNATVSATRPLNRGIFSRLNGANGAPRFDALWLHGYSSLNALQALLAAKVLGIPVLLRAEPWLSDRPRSPAKLLAKRLFFHGLKRFLAGVLPIGTRNRAYWRYYLGDALPLWSMPYAVDNEYFQRRSQRACSGRAALLAELDLDPSRPVILFASKLQTRKRCIDLLEAYMDLAPGGDPHPYLVIVGDGEERPALERRAATSGCHSIRFCGFHNQSELPRFFDIATVFVLPSRHEPWGLIVNEVMNAAKPIILSDDVGCHPDLLTDGVEGYLFPVGDVAALAQCLRKLFATPGTAKQMGESARARIENWSFEEDVRGLRQALAATTHKILP